MQSPVAKLLQIATNELGYLEKKTNAELYDKKANAGNNNWTKYASELDSFGCYDGKKNGYPWCDVFVDWCFMKAFGEQFMHAMLYQPHGGYGASTTNSAKYFKAFNQLFQKPQAGDQIFFTNDGGKTCFHTGIVASVGTEYVYTIEGNTSDSSEVVPNGGAVCAKKYKLTDKKIYGYGRPNWKLVESNESVAIIYNTLDQIPKWYKPSAEKALKKKSVDGTATILQGRENGQLDLTEDTLRILTMLDRLGLLD